jgi:hypothetical protein
VKHSIKDLFIWTGNIKVKAKVNLSWEIYLFVLNWAVVTTGGVVG